MLSILFGSSVSDFLSADKHTLLYFSKCRCKALARNDKVTHNFLFRGICTHKSTLQLQSIPF